MKIEKFVLLFVIPILVFLIWAMDSDAAVGDYVSWTYMGNTYKYICTSTDCELVYYISGNSFVAVHRKQNGTVASGVNNTRADYYINGTLQSNDYLISTFGKSNPDLVCTFPLFDTYNHAVAYLQNGETTGWTNKPPIDLEADGLLDEDIPVPKVIFDKTSSGCPTAFTFDNASLQYYVEVKGRYNSVDDLQWFRDGTGLKAAWKLRYFTVLHGDLGHWVTVDEEASSINRFYFAQVSADSLSSFLAQYPPASRTFREPEGSAYYKTISYIGMEDDTRDPMLTAMDSAYNAPEFYARFWYEDESHQLHYSKWAHALYTLPDSNGSVGAWMVSTELDDGGIQSDQGLTSDEVDQLEATGNSTADPSLVPDKVVNPIDDITFASALNSFSELLKSLSGFLPTMASFIAMAFTFLPWWVTGIISSSIIAVVLLRFLGR